MHMPCPCPRIRAGALKEEFAKDTEMLAAKLALVERKYDELVVKYEGRESRPEDLERIAELERQV
eukprot:SAG22_NODE_9524_length_585_cov_0.835391_1_plen_64_part_10